MPLCEGLLNGSTLTCHMHLWQWDIRTGAPFGIAEAPLQGYPLAREKVPAASFIVMHRLSALFARYLASSGIR